MMFAQIAADSRARFSLTVDYTLLKIFRDHDVSTIEIKRRLNCTYGKFGASLADMQRAANVSAPLHGGGYGLFGNGIFGGLFG